MSEKAADHIASLSRKLYEARAEIQTLRNCAEARADLIDALQAKLDELRNQSAFRPEDGKWTIEPNKIWVANDERRDTLIDALQAKLDELRGTQASAKDSDVPMTKTLDELSDENMLCSVSSDGFLRMLQFAHARGLLAEAMRKANVMSLPQTTEMETQAQMNEQNQAFPARALRGGDGVFLG
jgi:hypothetical protein